MKNAPELPRYLMHATGAVVGTKPQEAFDLHHHHPLPLIARKQTEERLAPRLARTRGQRCVLIRIGQSYAGPGKKIREWTESVFPLIIYETYTRNNSVRRRFNRGVCVYDYCRNIAYLLRRLPIYGDTYSQCKCAQLSQYLPPLMLSLHKYQ